MHIQIVNFKLRDMTEAEYLAVCDHVAPAFSSVPGLISKVWIRNSAANTYGGVYTWKDRSAMEAYQSSALFQAISTDEQFAEFSSVDFDVLEEPTGWTRGIAA